MYKRQVEDSLYLREYAKVFAWGMTKAKDMQTIRTYYSLLSFVTESEDAARLHYLKHFGLTDEGIQSLQMCIRDRYKSPRFAYLPTFTGGLVGYFSYDYLG